MLVRTNSEPRGLPRSQRPSQGRTAKPRRAQRHRTVTDSPQRHRGTEKSHHRMFDLAMRCLSVIPVPDAGAVVIPSTATPRAGACPWGKGQPVPVTLSGAASEAAESKGPLWLLEPYSHQLRSELREILRLATLAQNDRKRMASSCHPGDGWGFRAIKTRFRPWHRNDLRARIASFQMRCLCDDLYLLRVLAVQIVRRPPRPPRSLRCNSRTVKDRSRH